MTTKRHPKMKAVIAIYGIFINNKTAITSLVTTQKADSFAASNAVSALATR